MFHISRSSGSVPARRRARIAIGAVAATAALVLSGCAADDGGGGGDGQTEISVMLGTNFLSSNDIITVILPEELGYYEEEGLNVDVLFSPSGGQIMQLISAGSVDIGFGSSGQTLAARCDLDVDVTSIYQVLRKFATSIAVPADSPIKDASDLKGTTIGIVAEGSSRAFDARAMVSAAGLEPDTDVKFLAVGVGAQALQALENDTVQALVLWDQAYAEMENQGAEFRYFTFPFADGLFSNTWNSSDDFIAANPDVIEGFGRAQSKAIEFARTNPEAAVEIFLDSHPELIPSGVDRDTAFQNALNVLNNNLGNMEVSDGVADGSFAPDAWEPVMDYVLDLGLLKEPCDDLSVLSVPDSVNQAMNDFDHDAIAKQAEDWKAEDAG